MSLIYLAQPFSHPDRAVRRKRYEAAVYTFAYYTREGLAAFSPIAHSYDAAENYNLDTGYEQWRKVSEEILPVCNRFIVLMLHGWRESKGVVEETEFWIKINGTFRTPRFRVEYLPPRHIGLREDGEPL
jgi:hypothetical protein